MAIRAVHSPSGRVTSIENVSPSFFGTCVCEMAFHTLMLLMSPPPERTIFLKVTVQVPANAGSEAAAMSFKRFKVVCDFNHSTHE